MNGSLTTCNVKWGKCKRYQTGLQFSIEELHSDNISSLHRRAVQRKTVYTLAGGKVTINWIVLNTCVY